MPKAVVIEKVDGKPGQVYYPLKLITVPAPNPSSDELVVRMSHAALNHRDLFIRQHQYPGVSFDVPLLADGCGTVVSAGSPGLTARWQGKRVILTPGRGWASAPEGPEGGAYAILGGTKTCPLGTLQEYVIVEADEVEEAPAHLSGAEAAALPLAGLTAWRALFTKSGNALPGRNILITGIGGGVALVALQLACAEGCNVFVTSGSQEKVQKAKALGARSGVSYKDEGWEKHLLKDLPEARRYFDAIIDGTGGDVVAKACTLLKPGGVIVSYGMTLGPKIPFSMSAVMKNLEVWPVKHPSPRDLSPNVEQVRGSTMGSRAEFAAMTSFVRDKHLRPVVSHVTESGPGLDNLSGIDGLFEHMRNASQFGKLVVHIGPEDGDGGEQSRL
ncbi:MAG: hypothetical protein M1832_004046 [Thelocarpon impressellum]|nr:MAG: hypothetical protein M1832_004046 [Thelocarpon impressellum]